jgi:cytochrome c2
MSAEYLLGAAKRTEKESIKAMRMILIAGIMLIFLCSAAMGQAPLIEDPTRGARLFVSKGCERCHALKGEGGKVGPDLGRIDLGETQFGLQQTHQPYTDDATAYGEVNCRQSTGEN